MTRVRFEVPDISCNHCKTSIEGAVGQLTGVADVSVDVPTKSVEVGYDAASLDKVDLIAAIEEQGYEVAG